MLSDNDVIQTELLIEYRPAGPRGKGKSAVVARLPGGGTVLDTFTLADARAREGFADRVCEGRPGLVRDEVLAKLGELAAQETFGPESDDDAEPSPARLSQADLLLSILQDTEGVGLFHTPDGEAYVSMPVGGHRETWRVNSKPFREWLQHRCYQAAGKVPGAQAVQDAVCTISGIAKFDAPVMPVFLRIAEHEGEVWLDLGDPDWTAVRITTSGWEIVPSTEVPVRFVRRPSMQALPTPVRGGSVEELRPLVNLPDDDAWTLYVGWLVGSFHPKGPYGVLSISGEQGSAKSTASKLARRSVDPSVTDLRRPPKDERDIFISAKGGWICAYNNLSGLKAELSDALCALATDGGFATRALYTDEDETVFAARRPVILNGIEEPASRSDLVDRTIALKLAPIAEEGRLEEAEIMARFERVQPRVLGALLTAVSSALRNRGGVRLRRKPRMADLAVWVTAAEEGLGWRPERFVDAYMGNRALAHVEVVENSIIGPAVMALVADGPWSGNATELLAALNILRGLAPAPAEWPRTAKGVSEALRRLAPNLRACGIAVEIADRATGRAKRKLIHLERVGAAPSASSAPPAERNVAGEGAGCAEGCAPACSHGEVRP